MGIHRVGVHVTSAAYVHAHIIMQIASSKPVSLLLLIAGNSRNNS
jgi:hypothetical protein